MPKRYDVVVLTESPDDCPRTWPAIKHIVEPLEDQGFSVKRMSVLGGDPKNGKSATKTELKAAEGVLTELSWHDFVILVGNTPLQLVTGSAGITRERGRPRKVGNTLYLPINNPSILAHDPTQLSVLLNDIQLARDIINFGSIPEEKSLDIRVVQGRFDFREMLKDLARNRFVSYDVETSCLNPFATDAKLISIGFGTAKHQWIVPINHRQSPMSQRVVEAWADELVEVLEDCQLIMHNGKFDCLWTWVHLGLRLTNGFDTMLAHYLLDENSRHGLKHLAQTMLGAPDWEVGLDTKQGKAQLLDLAKYHAHDLFYTRELRFKLLDQLAEDPDVHEVFKHLMMPIANLFVEIEYDGVFIDVDRFADAEAALREQYDGALERLKQWEPTGLSDDRGRPVEFNWGSPQQLAQLLFGNPKTSPYGRHSLGLDVVEYTDSGNPSCSESVLNRLDHPMVKDLLKFREAKQQLSFFIDGWKPHLHQRPDGYYLHPSFKLHGTVTGRLSCENPNLQQVPRDPRIRTLITAPEGWTLLECDLSQVELRIAAELSGDRSMLYAFTHGIDIHWLTALSEIERGGGLTELVLDTARTWKQDKTLDYSTSIKVLLEMGPDAAIEIRKEWKEFRKKAKAVNFGYLYGMWWKKFKDYARDSYGVHITDEEAEGSRNAFFDKYADLPDWHKYQKTFASRHGYVPTLTGRKRRLPDAMIRSEDPVLKARMKAAQRQAINSPVQSYANDHNLMAALHLRDEYGRDKVRICGTVHDAILLRVKNSYVEEVTRRLMVIMSRPKLMDVFNIDMQVPLEADASIGPWGAGVSLAKWKEAQNG